MKVTRGTPPKAFVPIHITLESEEEADILWRALNFGGTDTTPIWEQFSAVHRPCTGKKREKRNV